MDKETMLSPDNSLEGKRMAFIESNKDRLLHLTLSDIVNLDNITKRDNSAPQIDTTSIKLRQGEYSSNNGIALVCGKDSSGNETFYLSMGLDHSVLQDAGFKQVSDYVPFSNGVNKERVPYVARFLAAEGERADLKRMREEEKLKAGDAKYTV